MTTSPAKAQNLYALFLAATLGVLLVMGVDLPRFYAFGPGLIGVIFFLLYRPVYGQKPRLPLPTLAIVGFILLFGLLSTAHAQDAGATFDRTLKLAGMLIPSAFLIGVAQNINPARLKSHLSILPWALITTALLIAFELQAGAPLYKLLRNMPHDESIAHSVFNRGTVVAVLCFFPVLTIFKLYRPVKIAASLLGVAFLIMLASVESQSAQLAMVISLLTFWLFPYRCKCSWIAWIALFAVIAALILSAPFVMPWLFTHLATTMDGMPVVGKGNGFAGARMEIWDYVSRYILQDPLYGFGIEATRTIENFDSAEIYQKGTTILHPHNFALQVWIEFGIIGALAAVALCGYILRAIYSFGPRGARITLPVFMATLSVGATGYGIWQGWWLGALVLATALCLIAVKIENSEEEKT